MRGRAEATPARHHRLRGAVVWSLGAVFFAVFVARSGMRDALPLLGRLTPGSMALVLALDAAIPLLKLLRWHMLLGASGVATRRRDLLAPVSAGFFWGLVTPGTSGEMGRGLLLGIPRRAGVATVFFEKLYDGVALVGLAAAAVLARVVLGRGYGHAVAYTLAIATVLAFLLLPWIAARLAARRDPERLGDGPRARVLRVLVAVRDLAHAPRVAVLGAGVSVVLWLLTGAQFVVLVRVLGAPHFPWSGVGLGFFVPYILGIVSLVPLGLGVLELGVAELLARYYFVSAGTAHATALAFRLLVTLPFVLWGFACYSWQAAATRRRQRALAGLDPPVERRARESG